MYTKTTNDIKVTVTPHFLEDETDAYQARYIWAYHIKIENLGSVKVKLLSRKWIITDSQGLVETVEGEGVLGEQPELDPGDEYEYTSGVPLTTPSGFMTGHYYMRTEFEDMIDVEIPTFSLDSPFEPHSIH